MARTKIDKNTAIMLLRQGKTPIEILKKHTGFTKMQLAAFSAHLTMGTYPSKQRIIKLLKMGYSPKEITQSYDGWTIMQIAALKAHLTMGTY
ncbi:MAG: hypothetical protein WC460_03360 [Patescibacteria group bacterium]